MTVQQVTRNFQDAVAQGLAQEKRFQVTGKPLHQSGREVLAEIARSLAPPHRGAELDLSNGKDGKPVAPALGEPEKLGCARLPDVQFYCRARLQVVQGQTLAPFAKDRGGEGFAADFSRLELRVRFQRNA